MRRTRDFLEREFKNLPQVLAKLLFLKSANEESVFQAELDTLLHEWTHLSMESLEVVQPDELIDFLASQRLNQEQIAISAYILKEKGTLTLDVDKKKDFFTKALLLLEWVTANSTTLSLENEWTIQELKNQLLLLQA